MAKRTRWVSVLHNFFSEEFSFGMNQIIPILNGFFVPNYLKDVQLADARKQISEVRDNLKEKIKKLRQFYSLDKVYFFYK